MAYPKGKPRPAGAGRKKGEPNKVTTEARQVIVSFLDANLPRLQEWLDRIAKDPEQGPAVAFKLVTDLIEYSVPKLSRSEITGANGGPLLTRDISAQERAVKLLALAQRGKPSE